MDHHMSDDELKKCITHNTDIDQQAQNETNARHGCE
jgi:hypothetical protein